jgi:hypothetical protein
VVMDEDEHGGIDRERGHPRARLQAALAEA